MYCKIKINNSYCIVESPEIYHLIPIIEKVCTFRNYYYSKNWVTKKPERKLRVLSYYNFQNKKIYFPRGWLSRVISVFKYNNVDFKIIDERPPFLLKPIQLNNLSLYDYQLEAVKSAIENRYGIIHHIMGAGKTIVSIGLISMVGTPGLVMVPPSKMLMYQFRDEINKYLPQLKVGIIGDSTLEIGDITVGTSVSLYLKRDKLKEFYKGPLQFLILDEAHKIREGNFDLKNQYFYVSLMVNAQMKIALTATPGDSGTLKRNLLEGVTGPVIHKVDYNEALNHGIVTKLEVYIFDIPLIKYVNYEYHKAYTENLLENNHLYQRIIEITNECIKRKLPTLIICDRVDSQLKVIHDMIPGSEILYGDSTSEERDRIKAEFEKGKINVLISTLIKEGINIKNIRVIILAGGGKDSDVLLQKVGRGLRVKEGKDKLILIDFRYDKVSTGVSGILRNHSLNRIRTYKKLGGKVSFIKEIGEINWP